MTITDTGGLPESLLFFEDFSEGEGEGVERKKLDTRPAILTRYAEQDLELELLVGSRILVQFQLEGQPERFLKNWIEITDLASLEKLPDSDPVPLPAVIDIVKIDQLAPDRSNVYRLATSSSRAIAEDLAAEEQNEQRWIESIPELPEELDIDIGATDDH